MRDLNQNAGAVTAGHVVTSTSAVIHVTEHAKGIPDNLMRFPALQIGHKSNSTTVPLELGAV